VIDAINVFELTQGNVHLQSRPGPSRADWLGKGIQPLAVAHVLSTEVDAASSQHAPVPPTPGGTLIFAVFSGHDV
jgi:hypothetical protein